MECILENNNPIFQKLVSNSTNSQLFQTHQHQIHFLKVLMKKTTFEIWNHRPVLICDVHIAKEIFLQYFSISNINQYQLRTTKYAASYNMATSNNQPELHKEDKQIGLIRTNEKLVHTGHNIIK